MVRKYWLDLFTGKTWEEFLEHGAKVSGFRANRKKLAERISPGDYFLCYLTGISRFVAILKVKSECYTDTTPIWKEDQFPIRFDVELAEIPPPSKVAELPNIDPPFIVSEPALSIPPSNTGALLIGFQW